MISSYKNWAFYLFFSLSSIDASATLPSRIPEDNWQTLSKILYENTTSASWRDEFGHSRIYFQIIYGSEKLAIQFINSDPSSAVRLEGGVRLIVYASAYGLQGVVRTLIKKGASVESISADAESPLMFAAEKGHLEIMRILISAKANVEFTTSSGMNAMRRALLAGQSNAAHLLVDFGYDLNAARIMQYQGNLLFDAISGNSYEAVSMLINNSFNRTQKNQEGDTPLSFAIKNHAQPRIIELLLKSEDCACAVNKQ